ncbi:class I SAM-dependent methyltransferase [Streptomyces achromogenes]|uniref:class I SAM-dependent methyltransferase n=1 Tax=Streptomyces achromogenes TaxID=67255 RepID=UPI0036A77107
MVPGPAGSTAVDLGCGPGHTSLALAGLGLDPVFAVDLSEPLLDELAAHATGTPEVRPMRADVRTALPELVRPGSVGAVVCLGDTLTHLPTRGAVAALCADVAAALAPEGTAVFAYRDLTIPHPGPRERRLVLERPQLAAALPRLGAGAVPRRRAAGGARARRAGGHADGGPQAGVVTAARTAPRRSLW